MATFQAEAALDLPQRFEDKPKVVDVRIAQFNNIGSMDRTKRTAMNRVHPEMISARKDSGNLECSILMDVAGKGRRFALHIGRDQHDYTLSRIGPGVLRGVEAGNLAAD